MTDLKTYRVLREMEGDRFYKAGETRELAPADAMHLLRLGVIEEVKSEGAPLNKAEGAPVNKGGRTAKAKG